MPKDCGLRTSSEPGYIVGQLTLWCLPVSLSLIPEAGQGLKSHLGHSPAHFELRRGNPVLSLPSTSFLNSQPKVLVAQSCPILCDPVDCSSPGFSVHGIPEARKLE
ncbi:unnamed protein product [Rangifer tarandus platyrhynchus]|uniref:Uncharacterized protein n=2 Tax=Rangifer tarandus platyrhynchus TaxID=3082113 RepID=A0AC60A0F8_RANTA|nr:unnamed protein product [Rangifer tarandus platyrhynchus]